MLSTRWEAKHELAKCKANISQATVSHLSRHLDLLSTLCQLVLTDQTFNNNNTDLTIVIPLCVTLLHERRWMDRELALSLARERHGQKLRQQQQSSPCVILVRMTQLFTFC